MLMHDNPSIKKIYNKYEECVHHIIKTLGLERERGRVLRKAPKEI